MAVRSTTFSPTKRLENSKIVRGAGLRGQVQRGELADRNPAGCRAINARNAQHFETFKFQSTI